MSGLMSGRETGAPVLGWINGGGRVCGSKTALGQLNPANLIAASQENGKEGVVYVAMNYRVGMFLCCRFQFSGLFCTLSKNR
ncbi:hypothetical protein NHQ30_009741 [Ciborinia camelliae]|nr:hypothetical protein NHQ30_009741 [Ciborinia camelliae]